METQSTIKPSRAVRINAETLRTSFPIITLIVLVIVVGILSPEFLSPQTLVVLASNTAILFVLAAGETFVIMLGGIDLSIQAIAALCSVIAAIALSQYRLGYLSFPVGVLVGLIAGVLNGVVHTKVRIPSFIATLAASGVWVGMALVISNGGPVPIAIADADLVQWAIGRTAGIPNEVIIGGLILLFSFFVQRYTPFGRFSTAIGAGEEATLASGISVNRYKMIAFAISGMMAGLAGVMLAARQSAGSPRSADGFQLLAIATVIVGGTAATGGVGSVSRTIIGALIVSVVQIGMTYVGVDIFAQQIVFGIMLVLAVAVTIDRSKIPIVK